MDEKGMIKNLDMLRAVKERTLPRLDPALGKQARVIILLHCIVSTAGMVFSVNVVKLFYNTAYLQYQLSSACLIIIGVELIMMITSYSLDSVVDVMLLAVSRQMLVEHTAPLENLLTVISVGLLFLIRKYLYISKIDKRTQSGKKSESNLSSPHT